MKLPAEAVTHSPEETIDFARRFAKTLKPGSVLAIQGNLGAGKTTFIKGLALGLGLKDADQVKSPTFAVMQLYRTRIPLYHFDLYRLETGKEVQAIGLEEFVNLPGAISCIEWPEKAREVLPAGALLVRLEAEAPETRRIRVEAMSA